MHQYTILPVFADVEESIHELKDKGHRLYAFSNGSHRAVTGLLTHAGIIDAFDGVVSVEDTQVFKPSPVVYQHFNKVTVSKRSNSWLISGNAFDVMGAASYGMHSAWVQRSPESVYDPWEITPTITIHSLTELIEKLELANS